MRRVVVAAFCTIFVLGTISWVSGEEQIIFSEEFDILDEDIWQHFVTGWRANHEFQYYRNDRKNSYIQDGMLVIKPSLTADEYGEDFLYNGELNLWEEGCTEDMNIDGGCYISAHDEYIVNPIQSARIRSNIGFFFTYGRVEIKAQVPRGDWIWPAIWMYPQDEAYGSWPRSGEIDIMESRGNEDLKCDGADIGHQKMGSTLHWGPDSGQNRFQMTTWDRINTEHPYGSEMHIYELIWNEDGIAFRVDGEDLGAVYPPEGGFWELGGFSSGDNPWEDGSKMAPFDEKFHFILNVAIGGNYFPDGCVNGNGEKPWHGINVPGAMKSFWEANESWYPTWNADDYAMKIDYIRVYQDI